MHRFQAPLVLCGLCLFQLVSQAVWMRASPWEVLSIPDDFAHMMSLLHLQAVARMEGVGGLVGFLDEIHSHYPMVAHYPRVLVAHLVSPALEVVRLANVLYFVALVTGVYLLGRLLAGRGAGLLAAALVTLMPAVYGGLRSAGLDYPGLCLMPWPLYFLLRSDGLRSPVPSLLFGLSAGVAALVRGQTLLFLFWPALVVLGRGAWQAYRVGGWRGVGRPLACAAASLAALAAATATWWYGRLDMFWAQAASHSTGQGMDFHEGDITLAGGAEFVFTSLPFLFSGPGVVALILLGAVFARRPGRRLELAASVLVPLALFCFIALRHHRYLMFAVPACAVVIGAGIWSLLANWRGPAAAVVAGALLYMWLCCSTGTGWLAGCEPVEVRSGRFLARCGDCAYTAARPTGSPRHMETQAAALAERLSAAHPDGSRALLYVDGTFPPLVQLALSLKGRLPGLSVVARRTVRGQVLPVPALPPGWTVYELDQEPAQVKGGIHVTLPTVGVWTKQRVRFYPRPPVSAAP